MAPPQKRTKLYAADATGRWTGADSMTTCVISVFVTPRNVPATMTQTISAVCEACRTPITASRTAVPASAPASPRMSPKRREMGGATKTANTASITPQAQKT